MCPLDRLLLLPVTRKKLPRFTICHSFVLLPTQSRTLRQLNSDTIHSIKRGVEFGRMLQLPDDVSFNSEHMADILTAEGIVRPFGQMK